jgi:hypothetical protein
LNYETGLGYPVISGTNKSNDGTLYVAMKTIFNPYFKVESRCYYNLSKRMIYGKDISNFSANFLSVYYKFELYGMLKAVNEVEEHLEWNVNQFGLMWGMQRSFGCNNGMYFNFAIGPVIKTNLSTTVELIPTGCLGFGFQL